VSTILKALQKLEREKESDRSTGPTPVFSKSYSTTGGVAGWFLNPWARRATMGIILIVLSGAAIHFYRQSRPHVPPHRRDRSPAVENPARASREQPAPSALPPIAKKTPNPAEIKNTPRPDQSTSALPPPGSQTRSETPEVNRNRQQPDRPALSRIRQQLVQERPVQAPKAPDDPAGRHPGNAIRRPGSAGRPATEISVTPTDAGTKEAAPAKPTQETNVAAEIEAPADVYKDTPPLNDGRLKVHAIAWSPTAEERMAVVNNRVIYEGDSVDSFVVVAIRPDDVVVREKGKGIWKVVFGRP